MFYIRSFFGKSFLHAFLASALLGQLALSPAWSADDHKDNSGTANAELPALLDGSRFNEPLDLDRLSYETDITNAANHATKWFWAEFGQQPPADLALVLTEAEQTNVAMVMALYDETTEQLFEVERAANREILMKKAFADPTKTIHSYEERIKNHSIRMNYFLNVEEIMRKDPSRRFPAEPAVREPHVISSAIEARVLALRELQQAYVEMAKYSGRSPRLGKVAAYLDKASDWIGKILPKQMGAALGAGGLGYLAVSGEEAEFASQLTVFSSSAVVGGVAGYTCAWLLSGIPAGINGWFLMPTINGYTAPRYARKVFRKAFNTKRTAPIRIRLETFGKKKV